MSINPSSAALKYSLLDLSPIIQGGSPALSYQQTVELARYAETRGYYRYWLAEHHNIPSVASAATAVLIGHVAGATKTMRVGSGGVMLPNHAPLAVAEQFGTLESLYPGRIDLGLGRAPGGDPLTAHALRRGSSSNASSFPDDLAELMAYFEPASSSAQSQAVDDASPLVTSQGVRAIPGQGLAVPIYLLGSSDFSARLAARLGLPFAFASHFAPDALELALQLYREQYVPSKRWPLPYVMVGLNVALASTDEQARRLFTTTQQQFLNMVRGAPGPLQPPVDSMQSRWSEMEQQHVQSRTRLAIVGSPSTAREKLREIIRVTRPNELILAASIYDLQDRLKSFELAAQVIRELP
jgi:luciferase family oxidoreductase group 1